MGTLLLALAFGVWQPTQPSTGSATIRGQVVDKASGEPLANAVVSLRNMREQSAIQQYTDARGRFQFVGVAAGAYQLRAAAGLYRTTHVPVTYLMSAEGTGGAFNVKDGDERSDIVIALPRALAISGRVLDEAGHPLTNISVTARERHRRANVASPRSRSTDDRGIFRLHGLAPGEYVVCAEIRAPTMFGDFPNRGRHYQMTCYPTARDAADAVEVRLTDTDVDGIEMRMPRSSLHTISGVVVTTLGAPPENATISFTRFDGSSTNSMRTQLQPSGAFTISNVSPGTYEVVAQLGRSSGGSHPDDREPQWGIVQVDVTTANVEGIIIVIKPGVAVKGRVTFEDPPQGSTPEPLRIVQRPSRRFGSRPTGTAATSASDGSFELTGLFGPVVLGIGGPMPPGYVLKSIQFRGRDITHAPVEFDGDPAHRVDIVLTNRTAEISGRVFDEGGQPVTRAAIVHFPADRATWKTFDDWRSVGVSPDGSYRVTLLPAGDYVVAAVPLAAFTVLTMPDDIERLAEIGERVTVGEHDRRTVDLRFSSIPPRRKR